MKLWSLTETEPGGSEDLSIIRTYFSASFSYIDKSLHDIQILDIPRAVSGIHFLSIRRDPEIYWILRGAVCCRPQPDPFYRRP